MEQHSDNLDDEDYCEKEDEDQADRFEFQISVPDLNHRIELLNENTWFKMSNFAPTWSKLKPRGLRNLTRDLP